MNKELARFGENKTILRQKKMGAKENKTSITSTFLDQNRIFIDLTYLFNTSGEDSIAKKDIEALIPRIIDANKRLKNEEGDILDNKIPMTGWQNLPEEINEEHIREIKDITDSLSKKIDAFVSIGIGGSYAGTKAIEESLNNPKYFSPIRLKFNRIMFDKLDGKAGERAAHKIKELYIKE